MTLEVKIGGLQVWKHFIPGSTLDFPSSVGDGEVMVLLSIRVRWAAACYLAFHSVGKTGLATN